MKSWKEFGVHPVEANRNLLAEQDQAVNGLLSFEECKGLVWAVVLAALFTLARSAADGVQEEWLFQDVCCWGECVFKTMIFFF